MPTQQPVWKLIGTVGDINPIDHDGGFIYTDETGVYPPELEYIINDQSHKAEAGPWTVYRIMLERFDADSITREWFYDDIEDVASYVSLPIYELTEALMSEDATMRAMVYTELAQYHGWENFDGYPTRFTSRAELEARYAERNK